MKNIILSLITVLLFGCETSSIYQKVACGGSLPEGAVLNNGSTYKKYQGGDDIIFNYSTMGDCSWVARPKLPLGTQTDQEIQGKNRSLWYDERGDSVISTGSVAGPNPKIILGTELIFYNLEDSYFHLNEGYTYNISETIGGTTTDNINTADLALGLHTLSLVVYDNSTGLSSDPFEFTIKIVNPVLVVFDATETQDNIFLPVLDGTPGAPMEYIVNNFYADWIAPDTINLSGLNLDSTSPTFSPTLHLFIAIESSNTVISVSSAGGYTAGFDSALTDLKITLIGVDLLNGVTDQNAVINDLLANQLLVF